MSVRRVALTYSSSNLAVSSRSPSLDSREMEVSQSRMNWVLDSNTIDNSTIMMFASDGNVAPGSGYYQRLLSDIDHEDMMIPPQSDDQADHADVILFPDDLEQLDWESSQHLPWMPIEDLQCPSTIQTIPIPFSTVDQSEESTETREDQSPESAEPAAEYGRQCSYGHIGDSTSRPVLPPGEKIGVSYHKRNKQYEAHLWIKGPKLRERKKNGVQIFLGNFKTEEEAKMAHDRAAIKLNIPPSARGGKPYPLNFPEAVNASFMEEHADWTPRDFVWKIRRTSNKFSKGKSSLKGVTVRKRSVKRGLEWAFSYESKVSLTAKECGDDLKRTFMLGNFRSEEEAGEAYDRALLFLHQRRSEVEQLRCITNYKPSSYSAEDIQSMASKLSWQLPD